MTRVVSKPLSRLLLGRLLVAYALVAVLVNGVHLLLDYRYAREEVKAALAALGDTYFYAAQDALWDFQNSALQAMVAGIGAHPLVVSVEIRDVEGLVGANWKAAASHQMAPDLVWKRTLPRKDLDQTEVTVLGYMTIASSEDLVWRQVWDGFQAGLAVAIAKLIVLGWVLWWLTRSLLARPLAAFLAQVQALSARGLGELRDGDLGQVAEIDGLRRAFNSLIRQLADSQSHIQEQNALLEQRVAHAIQAVRDKEACFLNIFERANTGVAFFNAGGQITEANASLAALLGHGPGTLRGLSLVDITAVEDLVQAEELVADLVAGQRDDGRMELRLVAKDGGTLWVDLSITAIRNNQGELQYLAGLFGDIRERKLAAESIERLAHQDALTGLFNRFSLETRLEQALLSERRSGRQLAVLFIDLDRFKYINDTLGHGIGDRLLKEVAHRLKVAVRASDIVARQGGDEFVVVLTSMGQLLDAAAVANKILIALNEPYLIEGHTLHTSPSIGIATFPVDGETPHTLMKNADTAMYHAKDKGRNNVQFFDPSMTQAAAERLELEADLRVAVADHQFQLYYQPQVYARDGRLHGVEALLRWNHPVRGWVSPARFVPVAEEIGLISKLGAWVMEEACRQLAEWRNAGIQPLPRMAVNLSAHQLRDRDLLDQVRCCLERYGLREGDLELEVTESVAMENPERAIGQLGVLRDLGVLLSIDDFGTGYSSLAYLKHLPIQALKLDRGFVRDIETDANDAEICAATIALAHSLGLKVVAEGVETQAQSDFLGGLHGCDLLQGYFFGRPEPAAHWSARWLQAARRDHQAA